MRFSRSLTLLVAVWAMALCQVSTAAVVNPMLAESAGTQDSLSVILFFDPSQTVSESQENRSAGATRAAKDNSFAHSLSESYQPSLATAFNQLSHDHVVRKFWITPALSVKIASSELSALASLPGVVSIVPDMPLSLVDPVSVAPAPAAVSTSVSNELALMNIPQVWRTGVTGKGRLVCSFDTGVKWDHPALSSKWRGLTHPLHSVLFAPLAPDSLPADKAGHGTHTMGIMVGSTPADTFGVAPGANWISASVVDQGKSLSATISDILGAFEWALNPDSNWATSDDVPDVILNSWGIPAGLFGPCDNTFWNAIDNVEAAGIVTIFAAGNEGPNPSTIRNPADRATTPTNSLAVGAIDANKVIANFSSRGPSNCSGAIKPDVVAPGVMIRSSFKDGGYMAMSGTSMAAPYIAGLVALGRQADPTATVEEIKQALLDAAEDLGPTGDDNAYGNGLVNAARFIENLRLRSSRAVEVLAASLPDTLLLPGDSSELNLQLRTFSPHPLLTATVVGADSAVAVRGEQTLSLHATALNGLFVSGNPLQFAISPNLPHGSTAHLTLEISDVDGVRDTISIPLSIGYFFPGSEQSLSAGALSLTISDFGRFGLAGGSSFNRSGGGLTLGNSGNLLYEGAVAATVNGSVVSAARDSIGRIGLPDFTPAMSLTQQLPSSGANDQVAASLLPRSAPLPIAIRQEIRTPSETGLAAVSFRFILTNQSDSTLSSVALGFLCDIDLPGGEQARTLANGGIVFRDAAGATIGLVPVNQVTEVTSLSSPTHKGGWASATFDSLMSPADSSLTSSIGDLLAIIHAGRFELPAGDSLFMEFVLVGATDPDSIDQVAAMGESWGKSFSAPGIQATLPSAFALAQNYPNPFNPSTMIRFSLAEPAGVTVTIHNVLGQLVATLALREPMTAGTHEIFWPGRGDHGETLSSGIYLLRVTAGENSQTRKMVLVK